MIKLIGMILIFVGSVSLGFFYSRRITERLKNSEGIQKGLICLRGEIQFGHTPLPVALFTVARHTEGVIAMFFKTISSQLEIDQGRRLEEVWEEQIASCLSGSELPKEVLILLSGLGQTMGYLDVTMQVDTLNLYLERLENLIRRQRKEQKEKVRLYNLLGIMGGIFVTILFI